MDLTDITQLKGLLSRFRIRPNDVLGQNFLVDREILQKIVTAAELKSTDFVLEIGPGLGILTEELAKRSGGVLAVEKDKRFIKPLRAVLRKFSNTEIINADILEFNFQEIVSSKFQVSSFKVVANIPYYLTSRLLRILLAQKVKPKLIVLLVQREVAERIVALPGEMSVLAASVQFYGRPEIISTVSRKVFFPPPEVDSAILRIRMYRTALFEVPEKKLFQLIKIGFSSPRKTLQNNLSAGLKRGKEEIKNILTALSLSEAVRAQELSLEDWHHLYQQLNGMVS